MEKSIGGEMKKEKVLLYVIKPVTLTYITGELAEYTNHLLTRGREELKR